MYLFFRKQGEKERARECSRGVGKLIIYVCLPLLRDEREYRRESVATSLVSLTEAALMKPPGGSLTCVAPSVSQLEHGGQPIPP